MLKTFQFLHSFKSIVALIFGLTFVTGCLSTDGSGNFYTTPEVSVQTIVPKGFDGNQVNFDIGLLVKNPNLIPLPIESISSNVKLNNIGLLNASSQLSQTIPANGTGQITVNARTDISSIRKLLQSVRSSTLDYQVDGKIGVANFTALPFSQQGKIDTVEIVSKLINYQ